MIDPGPHDRFVRAREQMVTGQLAMRGIRDAATLRAMGRVAREAFVPEALRHRSYDDGALSIGCRQTISQPYIVARMTEALDLGRWMTAHPGETTTVLDVGTGSGYQAAVLAEMGARVISIEREPALAREASERLSLLGYTVSVVVGDGTGGYPPEAPYAAIAAAAAAPKVPQPLLSQLAPEGRLVMPIGSRDRQVLVLVIGSQNGHTEQSLEPCVFVPLVGRHGFEA